MMIPEPISLSLSAATPLVKVIYFANQVHDVKYEAQAFLTRLDNIRVDRNEARRLRNLTAIHDTISAQLEWIDATIKRAAEAIEVLEQLAQAAISCSEQGKEMSYGQRFSWKVRGHSKLEWNEQTLKTSHDSLIQAINTMQRAESLLVIVGGLRKTSSFAKSAALPPSKAVAVIEMEEIFSPIAQDRMLTSQNTSRLSDTRAGRASLFDTSGAPTSQTIMRRDATFQKVDTAQRDSRTPLLISDRPSEPEIDLDDILPLRQNSTNLWGILDSAFVEGEEDMLMPISANDKSHNAHEVGPPRRNDSKLRGTAAGERMTRAERWLKNG